MKTTSRARGAARVFLKVTLALVSAYGALLLSLIALARVMHSRTLRRRIVEFNRRRLNPLTLRIAGNRSRVYAAIHHIGRRTGHAYTTPVVAEPLGYGFIIPLPYGTDVDWLHNVLAAGGCALTWNTIEYQLDHPEVIPAKDALPAFPWSQRIIFAGGGVTHFLTLRRRVAAVEAPEAPLATR